MTPASVSNTPTDISTIEFNSTFSAEYIPRTEYIQTVKTPFIFARMVLNIENICCNGAPAALTLSDIRSVALPKLSLNSDDNSRK